MRILKIKSKNTRSKCFTYNKEGYFRRDYPERKKNQSNKPKEIDNATVLLNGYDSTKVLTILETRVNKDCILDSGCSFHMCPNKSWFETLEENDHGVVLLGNNKGCRVMGSGAVRIRMFDGIERILQDLGMFQTLKEIESRWEY